MAIFVVEFFLQVKEYKVQSSLMSVYHRENDPLCCVEIKATVRYSYLPVVFSILKNYLEANFMKKNTFDHTPPVFNFLFSHLRKRKDFEYGRNTLGGTISFTS